MQALVQVRGEVNLTGDVRETLRMLNLGRVNHCTFVPETDPYRGMVQKVAEVVAFGPPSEEVVETVIRRRGEPLEGADSIDDEWVAAETSYDDVGALAVALVAEETTLREVGLSPVLRLHPPRGGHDGIKKSRHNGGVLGEHDREQIDALLHAMR